MNDDPISQLPEAYHAAWEILREPFDHDAILQKILNRTKEMANAESGMILLEDKFTGSFPEFRMLPYMERYVPIGTAAWLIYAFAKKTVQDGQGKLIVTTDELAQAESLRLIDKYIPLERREAIIKYAHHDKLMISPQFEVSETVPINVMFAPIEAEGKTIGTVCLSCPLSQGAFEINTLEQITAFLSFVGIAIKNAKTIRRSISAATENLYVIYHELKVPVASLQGYAGLLLGRVNGAQAKKSLTEEEKIAFLETIFGNAERLRHLIDSYTLLTKLDTHSILHREEKVKLSSVITPSVEKYRPLIQSKEQSLILNIDNVLDIEFNGSEYYYLDAVIETLIRNSHIYTPTGGEIKISVSLAKDTVELRISDTGLGLTTEEISKLFQKYYRSDRSEIREQRGAGMGLYLAKRLLDLWDGQIGAEGSPNQGSTFWFTLPLSKE